MRDLLALGFVTVGLLSGCGGTSIPAQMNIESSNQRPEFLMAEVTRAGGFALQKISFSAEGLRSSCKGTSLNGKVKIASNGLNKDSYQHKFPIICDDQREGIVMLELTISGAQGVTGNGYGEMNDGSVIKISVGNTSGGITW